MRMMRFVKHNVGRGLVSLAFLLSSIAAVVIGNPSKETSEKYKVLTTDYVWHEMVGFTKDATAKKGNQILHFNTKNRNPSADDVTGATAEYITRHLGSSKVFYSDADILKYAVEKGLESEGAFLEFGVCVGKTVNFIAALSPFRTVHGFDWFGGLPTDWTPRISKGTFAFKEHGTLPALHTNVLLHVGLFEDVLPLFDANYLQDQRIAFIHVDCDIYASTKSIFDHLSSKIQPGTVIIFDEYFGYDAWRDHEFKAFQEFVAAHEVTYEYLAYNAWHQQVVVRITGKKSA